MRVVNKKITTNFHQNGVTFCAVVVVVVVILFELGYNSFATKNKHISSNFGDCQGFQTLHFVSHISVCSQLRAHTFTLSQCDDRMISLALTLCECELVHMFKYRMTLFYTMPRIWTANSRIIHRFLRASTLITNSTTCSYAAAFSGRPNNRKYTKWILPRKSFRLCWFRSKKPMNVRKTSACASAQ